MEPFFSADIKPKDVRNSVPRDPDKRQGKVRITRVLILFIVLTILGFTYYFYAIKYKANSSDMLQDESAVPAKRFSFKLTGKSSHSASDTHKELPASFKLFPKGQTTIKGQDSTDGFRLFPKGIDKANKKQKPSKQRRITDAEELEKEEHTNHGSKSDDKNDDDDNEKVNEDTTNQKKQKEQEKARAVNTVEEQVNDLLKPNENSVTPKAKAVQTDNDGENSKTGEQTHLKTKEHEDQWREKFKQQQKLIKEQMAMLKQLQKKFKGKQNQLKERQQSKIQDQRQDNFQNRQQTYSKHQQTQKSPQPKQPVKEKSVAGGKNTIKPLPSQAVKQNKVNHNKQKKPPVDDKSLLKTKHNSLMDKAEIFDGEIKGRFRGLIIRQVDGGGNARYKLALNGVHGWVDPRLIQGNGMVKQSPLVNQAERLQGAQRKEQLPRGQNSHQSDLGTRSSWRQRTSASETNNQMRRGNRQIMNDLKNHVPYNYRRYPYAQQQYSDGRKNGNAAGLQKPDSGNWQGMRRNGIPVKSIFPGYGDRGYHRLPKPAHERPRKTGFDTNHKHWPQHKQFIGQNKNSHFKAKLENEMDDFFLKHLNDPLLLQRIQQLKGVLEHAKPGYEPEVRSPQNGPHTSYDRGRQKAVNPGYYGITRGGFYNRGRSHRPQATRISASVYNLQKPAKGGHRCPPLRLSVFSRKVCVPHHSSSTRFFQHVIRRGTWEETELIEFQAALSTSSALGVVDLGAGLGIYALMAAENKHKILAVEPWKKNYHLFHKTLQLNDLTDWVTLVTDGLGQRVGVGRLRYPRSHSRTRETVYVEPVKKKDAEKFAGDLVRIIRLDDLIPLMKFTSAVVKMEATGNVNKVLKGARKFFSQIDVQYVLMRWIPSKHALQYKEAEAFLRQNGLEPARSVTGKDLYTYQALQTDKDFIVWRKKP